MLGHAFTIARRASLLLVLAAGTLQAGEKKPATPAPPYEVEIIKGVAYYEGKDADKDRHQLDMYLPRGQKNSPVLFFLHGGGWRFGEKNQFGIYGPMGKMYARNGIGFVSINYRLSPAVQHPVHVQDAARAFAWVHANIARYGGRPEEIFVCGHSAGGHLCALLATDEVAADERYLKAEKLCLDDVCGCIPMSGAFVISKNFAFTPIFGEDKDVIRMASPITHAAKGVPPFLIVYGDDDLPGCDRRVAQAFHKALTGNGAQANILEVKDRNHITVLLLARNEDDPAARAMLSFIMSEVALRRLLAGDPSGFDVLGRFIASPVAQPANTGTPAPRP
jgi:acetyl esterase/lipase